MRILDGPMNDANKPVAVEAPSFREMAAVLLALVLVLGAQIAVSDSPSLLQRNFWVDEIHTYTLVADPDVVHSLRAAVGGVDSNPPVYHLLLRGFTYLTGGATEVTLRTFALLSVLVALVGVYVTLRQVYSSLIAFTSVLALWCHPLILYHAFEARTYGPWLAAVVWFCYLLSRARGPSRGPWLYVLLALTAVLVCTIHFFGIFALGLITCFELLFHRPRGTASWAGLPAAGLGLLAVLACTPILLAHRASFSAPSSTWIDRPELDGVIEFGSALLFPKHLVAVLIVAWLAALFGPAPGGAQEPAGPPPDRTALAGLTGLLLQPLALVVFSYLVQPAMLDRYSLPAVLALAPAVAFLVSGMSLRWTLTLCVFLVAVGTYGLHTSRAPYDGRDEKTEKLIADIREHTGDAPVLFESIHELYVVCRYAPDLAGRCFLLDFEPDQIGQADARRVMIRDQGRTYARYYPALGLMPWDQFRQLPKRYLVPEQDTYAERFSQPEECYPGFVPQDIAEGLLFELVPAGPVSQEEGPP
jgi:hypothetical protein